ncbi:hypothetical protein RRG08_060523 [Elysia crispata]|uniref:Uncharacterized protein n=1 Tax=Elysia crispata TaxID=231223 RepID=A0AAE1DV21_9GAST|nr:hypothetical protein RRG08_060523 [Elysia crispata]
MLEPLWSSFYGDAHTLSYFIDATCVYYSEVCLQAAKTQRPRDCSPESPQEYDLPNKNCTETRQYLGHCGSGGGCWMAVVRF